MQRDISDKNTLGSTLNPINDMDVLLQLTELHQTKMTPKKKYKKYESSLVWENTMQISSIIYLDWPI